MYFLKCINSAKLFLGMMKTYMPSVGISLIEILQIFPCVLKCNRSCCLSVLRITFVECVIQFFNSIKTTVLFSRVHLKITRKTSSRKKDIYTFVMRYITISRTVMIRVRKQTFYIGQTFSDLKFDSMELLLPEYEVFLYGKFYCFSLL